MKKKHAFIFSFYIFFIYIFKETNNCVNLGGTKLIQSDSKDIDNITKDLYFK